MNPIIAGSSVVAAGLAIGLAAIGPGVMCGQRRLATCPTQA